MPFATVTIGDKGDKTHYSAQMRFRKSYQSPADSSPYFTRLSCPFVYAVPFREMNVRA